MAAHHNESLTQAMRGHESGKMLIQHYRELVKPREALRYWALVPPPLESKIVRIMAA